MSEYTKPYFSPGKNAAEIVVGFIDRTNVYLDAAVYSITDDRVSNALIRAARRGVKVRVLMDKVQASSKYADDERMAAAGVIVRIDTQSGLMHNKFAISDGLAMKTGSYNWTINADEKNAENFLLCRIKKTIRLYQEEFDRIWELNAPEEATA